MDYNSMRSFTITLAHRAVEDIRRAAQRLTTDTIFFLKGVQG